jgi:DHA1 family bicyclomycin/chloramphenicol resistance-like MFS transporter
MAFPSWLPLLLGLLTAVGPISTDMYLPAFPAIEAAFGGHPGTAQVTLATWFAGLAFGQLTQGMLADRFGRRRPLIAATALYTLASVGCAVAPNLATLAVMRALAAFGGSASMVIPRAVVRDLADGHAAARLLSQLVLVMGVAPILAPTLGALVLRVAGWQAIFWIVAVYGGVCCILVWWTLPETLPPARRVRLGGTAIVLRHGWILVERSFLTNALVIGCVSFGLFAYLGGAPDVYVSRFGLSPSAFGVLFGVCSLAFIGASQFNPGLVRRFGPGPVMRAAVRVSLVAALVLCGLALADRGPWWAIAGSVAVMLATLSLTFPNATIGALSRHAAYAGSASALLGTMQFVLGAISGLSVGLIADGTAWPMAGLMLLGAVGAVVADLCRPRAAVTPG